MQYRILVLVCVVGLGLLTALGISSAARTDPGPTPPQDIIRLETRINQLEQRLYSIDTNLRTLEQQSRVGGPASRGVSQQDLNALRSEIQALQVRLAEHECGLAKLDERTLTPAMREARRKSSAWRDPCRANVDTPLQSSRRQE